MRKATSSLPQSTKRSKQRGSLVKVLAPATRKMLRLHMSLPGQRKQVLLFPPPRPGTTGSTLANYMQRWDIVHFGQEWPQGLHAVQKESRDSTIRTSTEASTAQRLSRRRPQHGYGGAGPRIVDTSPESSPGESAGSRSRHSRLAHRRTGPVNGDLFLGVKRKEIGSICVGDVGGTFGDRAERAAWQSVASDSSPKQEKATRCPSADAAICCQQWLRLQLLQQSVVIQMHHQDARKEDNQFSPQRQKNWVVFQARVARRHPFPHILWSGYGQRGSAFGVLPEDCEEGGSALGVPHGRWAYSTIAG